MRYFVQMTLLVVRKGQALWHQAQLVQPMEESLSFVGATGEEDAITE